MQQQLEFEGDFRRNGELFLGEKMDNGSEIEQFGISRKNGGHVTGDGIRAVPGITYEYDFLLSIRYTLVVWRRRSMSENVSDLRSSTYYIRHEYTEGAVR